MNGEEVIYGSASSENDGRDSAEEGAAATAPPNDGASSAPEQSGGSASSEGASASSDADPTGASEVDEHPPSAMDGDDSMPAGDASPDADSNDAPAPKPPGTNGHGAENAHDRETNVIIIDDPAILPAKSIQTKAEVIDDGENTNVVDAASYSDDVDDEMEKDEPLADAAKEATSTLSESIPSEPSHITDEASGDGERASKQEPADANNHAGSEIDPSNGDVNGNVASEGAPDGADGNKSSKSEAHDDSIESSSPQSSSSSDDEKEGDLSTPAISEDEGKQSSDETADHAQTVESSRKRNSSGEVQTDESDALDRNDASSDDGNATEDVNEKNETNDAKTGIPVDDEDEMPRKIKLVDYASKLAGAQILEQSSSLKGASNLLTSDRDRYSIAPCEDKKYVVIGLSEDILVKQIKLSNYERYSSRVKEFQVLASQEYPTKPIGNDENYWNSIGTYTAQSRAGEQTFDLSEPAWARYLKFRFLSHYGSEHYCTLTQIMVHGSTMLQGFHEQWIENEKKDRELEGGAAEEEEGVEKEVDEMRQDGESPSEEGANGADEGKDKTRETIDNAVDDSAVDSDENATKIQNAAESLVGNVEDSPTTSVAGEVENKTESSLNVVEEGIDAQFSNSTKSPKMDDEEASNDVDRPEESAPESKSVEEQSVGGSEEEDREVPPETKEVHVDSNHSLTPDEISDGDKLSKHAGSEIQENIPNVSKYMKDDPSPIQTESKSNATSEEIVEAQAMMKNDSSIAAVTDVVRAAVSDASDAIKNVTSDAIKNVKDAIRTRTATVAKTDEAAEEENNETLHEGMSSGDVIAEEEVGNIETIASNTSNATIHETPSAASEDTMVPSQTGDSSMEADRKDAAKSKAEEGSSNSNGTIDEASNSKLERETPKEKSTIATSSGQDTPQRKTAKITGKDGKDMDASKEMFEKLYQRFPHAACLKELDMQKFKSKSSLANSSSSGGHTSGSAGGGGAKMEPIFAKITNEIKSVQITQNQQETYINALKVCYETLIWDMAQELDEVQENVDQRLSRLERAVFLSEMRARGGKQNLAAYSRVTEMLRRTFPSFDVFVTPAIPPEGSEALCVCGLVIVVFLMILKCLPRRNTATAEARSGTGENGSIIPAGLTSRNELLERQNVELAGELADKDKKLETLQRKNANLEQEHAMLQQRYSQLEKTYASLETRSVQMNLAAREQEQAQRSKSDLKHVVFSVNSSCSTPTPSVQSEPVDTGMVTPPKAKPGRRTLKGDSARKSRFRKNKIMAR